jgi:CBS domain containing-hemolysin-like protein
VDRLAAALSVPLAALGEFLAFDPALLAAPDMVVRLVLMVLLLAASAFFSSAETALFSLSRLQLQELRHGGHGSADTIHELLDQPRRLIISILCGNELINVAATANMAAILLALYPPDVVIVVNLLIMVPLLLLFGEVTPKTIAVTNPSLVSTRISARPMKTWVRFVAPLRWLVRLLSERITTLLVGAERAPENILRVDEFRTLVEEVVESGELHAMERELIDNILAAGSTEVLEIMRPRTRVDFVDGDLAMAEIVEEMRRLRHRRLPVYRGAHDNVVGMLHAEDLANHLLDGDDPAGLSLADLLHPVAAVPPTKKVDELFAYFLAQETHAAVVVDEFGGVEGLVTLGDVIDFVFGRAPRQAGADQAVIDTGDGAWEADGALKLGRFCSLVRIELAEKRVTTVAGLLLKRLDRRPEVGDIVRVDGVTVRITAMDGLRIARVRIEPPGYEAPPAEAGSTGEEGGDDG